MATKKGNELTKPIILKAVKQKKSKKGEFKLSAKLANIKYNEPKKILSATVEIKLATPIGTLPLMKKNISTNVPVGKEVVFFKETIREENGAYIIELTGKVKMDTIKAGTLIITAKGTVYVYGIPITLTESYKLPFKL